MLRLNGSEIAVLDALLLSEFALARFCGLELQFSNGAILFQATNEPVQARNELGLD
jgi:hypothetical protein